MSESEAPSIIGMARLARRLVTGEDQSLLWAELSERVAADPTDAEALFDMAMLLRLSGKVEQSQALQAAALQMRTTYTCRHGAGAGLQVLVFVTGGDVMSNAPIDFLCEDSDLTLHFLHMDASDSVDIPPHDIAFVAMGHSETNRPVLEHLGPILANWDRPVMNAQTAHILNLTRDGTSALFAGSPVVLAPANLTVSRAAVEALAGGAAPGDLGTGFTYPLLIRPLDTHGGKGLEKIDGPSGWAAYLARYPEAGFFLAPFVDYSRADGLFRKLRITFIDGRPFATHLAVSEHWLVHYISAGMLENADKRAEEAAWMAGFYTDFAVRHAEALREIAEKVGVDYFSIDCAELADGRLLLFEADVASIVHALDPVEVFPYKRPAMRTLFDAFQAALAARVGAAAVQHAA